jgi:capsular polysaccharide biosynthesis protein
MENSFYTKEKHDLNIMDLVNLGIVVLISLKNTIIFLLVFFLLIGFLSTSNIEPQYSSQSRLLIELPNINLKDEQNIDFSSLNTQAIQTEIEKIKSNALLHNVITKKSIGIPQFEITRSNSSIITYLADRILTFSGLRFFIGLFQNVTSSTAQKAIETTLDVALDAVVTSVDEEEIFDFTYKIKNQFKLTDQQNQRLDELQSKFKNEKPDSEEVMSFAYGVLSNNDYSDQDIIELAKNYLPDSISLSDDMLLKLIEKYKGEYSIDDLNTYLPTGSPANSSSTTNKSSLVNDELDIEISNNSEEVQIVKTLSEKKRLN